MTYRSRKSPEVVELRLNNNRCTSLSQGQDQRRQKKNVQFGLQTEVKKSSMPSTKNPTNNAQSFELDKVTSQSSCYMSSSQNSQKDIEKYQTQDIKLATSFKAVSENNPKQQTPNRIQINNQNQNQKKLQPSKVNRCLCQSYQSSEEEQQQQSKLKYISVIDGVLYNRKDRGCVFSCGNKKNRKNSKQINKMNFDLSKLGSLKIGNQKKVDKLSQFICSQFASIVDQDEKTYMQISYQFEQEKLKMLQLGGIIKQEINKFNSGQIQNAIVFEQLQIKQQLINKRISQHINKLSNMIENKKQAIRN